MILRFCAHCAVLIRYDEIEDVKVCENCGESFDKRSDWAEGEFKDSEADKLKEV